MACGRLLSNESHALESCSAQWKMANGLWPWCVDGETNEIVHRGGALTWGDCHKVDGMVRRLIGSGHLPVDGDNGDPRECKKQAKVCSEQTEDRAARCS